MPRLYHFYFEGIEKPVTIEAPDQDYARQRLGFILDQLPPQYKDKQIVQQTNSSLLAGVSKKMVQGKPHVWNGAKWMEIKEEDKANKKQGTSNKEQDGK